MGEADEADEADERPDEEQGIRMACRIRFRRSAPVAAAAPYHGPEALMNAFSNACRIAAPFAPSKAVS
jgi:hypothetical protein